jgi:hypothetical protein
MARTGRIGKGAHGRFHGSASAPIEAGDRILLDEGHITYLGTAQLPQYLSDGSETSNEGGLTPVYRGAAALTTRVIAGTTYFIGNTFTPGSNLIWGAPFRFHCNSWEVAPPFPLCEEDELYATNAPLLFYPARENDSGNYQNDYKSGPLGSYWDEASQKYWYSFSASAYASQSGDFPSLGYSILDGVNSASPASYSFEDSFFPARVGPIIPVPQWFADAYFEGKNFLLCNRGLQSGGGYSMDPACIAIELPTGPHRTMVPATDYKQLMFRSNTDCSKRSERPVWAGDFLPGMTIQSQYAGGCGPGDEGNIGLLDFPGADMLWIDTGEIHGLLLFSHYSTGAANYISAYLPHGGMATGMQVIDPADLAATYAGTKPVDEVDPTNSWAYEYSIFDYDSIPFVLPTQIACTGYAVAATQRYRFECASPHGFSGGQAFFTGTADASLNGGGIVQSDGIISTSIFEGCLGQADGGNVNPADNGVGPCLSWPGGGNVTYPNVTIMGAVTNSFFDQSGVSGSVWMPTNSACGPDNTFAIAHSSFSIAGTYRHYISCFKVGE